MTPMSFCELLHSRIIGTDGRIQMGKTGLFAASVAAMIVACIAGWAVSDTQARVMMTSAKQLPWEHFADYSFVFD
jgi:hypothetical protein